MWGEFGQEMADQFVVFDEVDPTVRRGGPFINADELGILENDLVGSTEALEKLHAAGEL